VAHKLLGIDYGRVRVGLALAVDGQPQRLATLPNDNQLQTHLESLVAEHRITQVVVGLPRGIEGEETEQAAIAREFARQLEAAVNVPVALQDEFATSAVAHERLVAEKQPPAARPKLVDQEAAVIILEDYLNAR
jgi:putative Holliday junction resolvase